MSIEKVVIVDIRKYTTSKDGMPLKTRQGKPYTSVRIKTDKHGEQWLSGFGGKWNDDWQTGSQISIDVTEVIKNGVTYLNFGKATVENTGEVLAEYQKLSQKVDRIIQELKPMYDDWKEWRKDRTPKTSDNSPVPFLTDKEKDQFNEINPSEIF